MSIEKVMNMYETSVIVTVGSKAESLRSAVAAVLREPGAKRVEIVVVTEPGTKVDAAPLHSLAHAPHVIRIVPNQFSPGPAGARRTGILAATSSVIAFCDNGAAWERGRKRLAATPNA